MKKIVKSVLIITIFNVLARVIGLLVKIYISREISLEALGYYQIAVTAFLMLLSLVSTGIPTVLSREISAFPKKEKSLVSSSTLLLLMLGTIITIAIALSSNVFNKLWGQENSFNCLLVLLPAIFFSAICTGFRGSLWGRQEFFLMGLTEFIEQLIRLLSCFILFCFFSDTFTGEIHASLSLSISCVVSSLIYIALYFIKGGKVGINFKQIKPVFISSAPICVMKTLSSLVLWAVSIILPARLIISGATPTESVSLYGIMTGMALPLLTIPGTLIGSIAVAIIPELSNKSTESAKRQINASISVSTIISLVLVPLFIAVGDNIGIWLFSNEISGTMLRYGSLVLLPLGLSQITTSILNALGKEKFTLYNYLAGASVLMISVFLLTNSLGIYSFLVGMAAMSLINSLLNIIVLRKYLNIEPIKTFAKTLICLVPVTILTYYTFNISKHFTSMFFSLAISGSVCMISLFFLLSCFKLFNISLLFTKRKKFA